MLQVFDDTKDWDEAFEQERVVECADQEQMPPPEDGPTAGWQMMHADVNEAFDIIRKGFRHFRFHTGLTPKFWIWRSSQTAKPVKMRLAA